MSANLQPIAIVGVSALFPGSNDATGFWRDILAGRDLIGEVPASHWRIDDYYDADPAAADKTYARRGGFLSSVPFDALGFGVPPSTLPATDTSQLLALILAQAVLQDALGAQFETADRSRTSVILGVTSAQELLFSLVSRLQRPVWVKALRESGLPEDQVQRACDRIADHYVPWQEASFPGLLGNVVAGRIANRLNLGGTNCVTDAACASSFSAIAMAVQELQLGHSDLVISGGVDTLNDIFMYMCFSKTPALSPSGDCRPFSAGADGTLLGEGLGMVALKRLADAERAGDRIYAVLRGVGSSSDGRSKSVYAPVPAGQAQALRRAYALAGYGPETVELVEAHGTGTKAGDVAEFEGLRLAFGEHPDGRRQWCALGSVKSQIGHTKAAAGAAGLFKAVMALHHKVLPPTIKVDAPNPKLELERSPFYLNTEARPWIRSSEHPRRASVSAFGFGGSNFHLTLEEYLGPAARAERLPTQPVDLVLLAADDADTLRAQARALLHDERELSAIAGDSRAGWRPGSHRLALVVADREQLRTRLSTALSRIAAAPEREFQLPDGSSYGVGAGLGALGWLFPGQGSQYLGMGAGLAMQFESARQQWDAAAELQFDGLSLHQVVFPPPAFDPAGRAEQTDRLTATEWAQPALAACSLAQLALLRELGFSAQACAGHSFGELTALQAAGVCDGTTALQAARQRGEAMRDATGTAGGMLALALPRDRVQGLLEAIAADLVIANHNAPEQVVVSGPLAAIERFEAELQARGLSGKRLPVASAFHSALVAPAAERFTAALQALPLQPPAMPVFSNHDGRPFPADSAALAGQLGRQLAAPVDFVATVEAMYAAGVRAFVEVGAGSVLSGLVASILGARPHLAVALDRRGKNAIESLLIGLARLSSAGVGWQPARLFADVRPPVPTAAAKLAVAINGSNVGKPYPPPAGTALPAPNPARPLDRSFSATTSSAEPIATAALPAATAGLAVLTSTTPLPAAAAPPQPQPAIASPAPQAIESEPMHDSTAQAWLAAFAQQQAQTAAAHAAFQQAMSDSHRAYLQLAESALAGLAAVAGQEREPAAPGTALPLPQRYTTATANTPPTGAIATASALAAATAPVPVHSNAAKPEASQPAVLAVAPGHSAAGRDDRHAAAAVSNEAARDLAGLLLAVVAEKTGYPAEMLNLEMDLEGDLGVDSIKRVEILAAVDERAPQLPKVDRTRLAALHTLREIVEYLGAGQPPLAASAAPGRVDLPAVASSDCGSGRRDLGTAVDAATAVTVDLAGLLLAVVAEKTGYPAEMLNLEMDLEGDLGVDSIKRVEILAAVDERAPQLPKVDRTRLAALHTLREIVEYLGAGQSPLAASAAPGRVDLPAVASSDCGSGRGDLGTAVDAATAVTVDLAGLLLAVVAEKTGYPAEMLNLEMDLEGDLGVDSIKRVEILAAVDERAPQLPKVDRTRLAALHTLREIVEYLSAGIAAGSDTPALPSASATTGAADARLGRYRVELVDAPATGLAMPGLLQGEAVEVVGGGALGPALAAELQRRGVAASAVSDCSERAQRVIWLAPLDAARDRAAAGALNRRGFALARALAERLQSAEGLLVTVQDSGGDFGRSGGTESDAWAGGLPALLKTAALEWPRAALKAIDLQRGERSLERLALTLADELLAGGGEIEVALSADGRRRSLACVEAPLAAAGDELIEAGDVVVVSGGGRGVTAACLLPWAALRRPRLLLLGRSQLLEEPDECRGVDDEAALKRRLLQRAQADGRQLAPAALQAEVQSLRAQREVQSTLAGLQAAGVEARYLAIDVADAAALTAALQQVRSEWGPIRGLIHAAGVLADKRIAELSDTQFESVFRTKVDGLAALLTATADDPLKLLAVFSSVSARCGNTGQAAYAMANEVLNRVALQAAASRPGLRVKALGWGPWQGGMVSPALKQRFAELGVPMIPLAAGAAMFAAELASDDAVELVLGGEPRAEALLADGSRERIEALELRVNRRSHGYLQGHRVNGQPVVPLVLVAEWMARAAQSLRPGKALLALQDIRVLRGLRLADFDGGGECFRIEARALPGAGVRLELKLLDGEGRPRYSARAELGRSAVAATEALPSLPLERWQGEPIYSNLLFHREAFELIDDLRGISDQGVAAAVRGVHSADWPGEAWQLDVAALDGGLQMAVLYGQRMLGGPNLPTAIGELRRLAPLPAGPIEVAACRRHVGPSATTTDIYFADHTGRRFAELLGVENHALAQA